MSRTAKATLLASVLVTGITVYGVHFMQKSEREAMYQGVVKDEARIAARRERKNVDAVDPTTGVAVPNKTLFERQVEYERNLKLQEELGKEQGLRQSEVERTKLEQQRKTGRT